MKYLLVLMCVLAGCAPSPELHNFRCYTVSPTYSNKEYLVRIKYVDQDRQHVTLNVLDTKNRDAFYSHISLHDIRVKSKEDCEYFSQVYQFYKHSGTIKTLDTAEGGGEYHWRAME